MLIKYKLFLNKQIADGKKINFDNYKVNFDANLMCKLSSDALRLLKQFKDFSLT